MNLFSFMRRQPKEQQQRQAIVGVKRNGQTFGVHLENIGTTDYVNNPRLYDPVYPKSMIGKESRHDS